MQRGLVERNWPSFKRCLLPPSSGSGKQLGKVFAVDGSVAVYRTLGQTSGWGTWGSTVMKPFLLCRA